MRHRRTDLDDAHHAALHWGFQFGYVEGVGYPPCNTESTVQGSKPELSSPEEYAEKLDKWEHLDRAVREVGRESEFHAIVLREHYVLGHSVRRIADSFSLDVSDLKGRLDAALAMFWAAVPDEVRAEFQDNGRQRAAASGY